MLWFMENETGENCITLSVACIFDFWLSRSSLRSSRFLRSPWSFFFVSALSVFVWLVPLFLIMSSSSVFIHPLCLFIPCSENTHNDSTLLLLAELLNEFFAVCSNCTPLTNIYIPSYFFHQNACLYSYIVTYKFWFPVYF